MKIVNISKIGNDYGGDNYLYKIYVDEKKHNDFLKMLSNNYIEDEIWTINREQLTEFEWSYYSSYDNMDYNGFFFETMYIDKDNLFIMSDDDKFLISDKDVDELVLGSCEELMELLQLNYQSLLWERIGETNDIYEQYLDNECVSIEELKDLEKVMMKEMSIKEFEEKQGYEWSD